MLRKLAALALVLALPVSLSAQVTCTTAPFGKGCGPTLAGKVAPNKGPANKVFTHLLEVNTTGAPKLTLGLLIMGDAKVKDGWKLPFMDCNALINIRGMSVIRSDKDGVAKSELRFKALVGLNVHFQHLFFVFNPKKQGGISAKLSNGLTLTCTKSK
jgi:hypothetical protein